MNRNILMLWYFQIVAGNDVAHTRTQITMLPLKTPIVLNTSETIFENMLQEPVLPYLNNLFVCQ